MPTRNDEDLRDIFHRLNELERQAHTQAELAKLAKEQLEENTLGVARNRESCVIIQTKMGMVAGMFGIAGGIAGAILGAAVKALLHS